MEDWLLVSYCFIWPQLICLQGVSTEIVWPGVIDTLANPRRIVREMTSSQTAVEAAFIVDSLWKVRNTVYVKTNLMSLWTNKMWSFYTGGLYIQVQ